MTDKKKQANKYLPLHFSYENFYKIEIQTDQFSTQKCYNNLLQEIR